MDTVAQALLCQGQYAEAEGQIRAALAGQPTNAYLLVTLSSILYAQGRSIDATTALSDAQQALTSVKWPDATLLRRIEALKEVLEGSPATGGTSTREMPQAAAAD
jgi:predicted Zn-dependent protease